VPAVGKPDFKPDQSEPDSHRPGIDHGRAERAFEPRQEIALLHGPALNLVRQCHKPETNAP